MFYKIILVNKLVMMDFIIILKFVNLVILDVQNVIHQNLTNAFNANQLIFSYLIFVVHKTNNIYKMVNVNLNAI